MKKFLPAIVQWGGVLLLLAVAGIILSQAPRVQSRQALAVPDDCPANVWALEEDYGVRTYVCTSLPAATATVTAEPTATATSQPATATDVPTSTPEPPPTVAPTSTPETPPTAEPTATATPTNTPEPTAAPTVEPTATDTPTPTSTSTAVPTVTPTAVPPTHTPEPPTHTPEPPPTATATAAPTATPTDEPSGSTSFVETFDGNPSAPTPFESDQFVIVAMNRDVWRLGPDRMDSMQADHGSDCAAPGAKHTVTHHDQAAFICKNHVMTAINGIGYALETIQPTHGVDLSQATSIWFDVSTYRHSGRDWLDIAISDFYSQRVYPVAQDVAPTLSGAADNSISITQNLHRTQTLYKGLLVTNGVEQWLSGSGAVYVESYVPSVYPTAAKERQTFRLDLTPQQGGTKLHIEFSMIAPDGSAVTWTNATIDMPAWQFGVVQFGHHSYNPAKDGNLGPNTWHWDNFHIEPSVPYTAIKSSPRTLSTNNGTFVLDGIAPENAWLRAAYIGNNIQFSFDNGVSWVNVQKQIGETSADESFKTAWLPVPAGTTSVKVRGSSWWSGSWYVRDVTVFAE